MSSDVYINYPLKQTLSITIDGTTTEIDLNEDVLAEDSTTSYPNRVPSFHGYSASGEVSADYVYVGRGQQADFEALVALGVPLEGKIALARYGGPFRGLKVKNAQEHGMIGAVIFTDLADDGEISPLNGYETYPNGPARNPSSVQRGSVQFLSTYPGDPTTPGYPSHEGVGRASKSDTTPRIPSIPISYRNAGPVLAALDGYGSIPNRTIWKGNLSAQYMSGPNPGATLSLVNQMNETYTNIWDSIGIINGTSEDEVIIIGNHRDAWIVGGAADPNSGSAVMVELSKAFGALLKTGWKPKRTIVLCSWDMEEYGLVGSTEFVEEYIPWLSKAAVSYLNVDVATSGPVPDISATPELHTLVTETMKKVVFPNIGTADLYPQQTLYDVWTNLSAPLGVLGSGSDYTSFLHNGIGSVDLGAVNGKKDPIYHYHSNYDTYYWMTKFGDPGFNIHKAIGQYLSLLAYHLSSDEVIPYNVTTYTDRLQAYYTALEYTIGNSTCCTSIDLSELESAIETFGAAASGLADFAANSEMDEEAITLVNHKYRDFSRGFVSQGGLPDREVSSVAEVVSLCQANLCHSSTNTSCSRQASILVTQRRLIPASPRRWSSRRMPR